MLRAKTQIMGVIQKAIKKWTVPFLSGFLDNILSGPDMSAAYQMTIELREPPIMSHKSHNTVSTARTRLTPTEITLRASKRQNYCVGKEERCHCSAVRSYWLITSVQTQVSMLLILLIFYQILYLPTTFPYEKLCVWCTL